MPLEYVGAAPANAGGRRRMPSTRLPGPSFVAVESSARNSSRESRFPNRGDPGRGPRRGFGVSVISYPRPISTGPQFPVEIQDSAAKIDYEIPTPQSIVYVNTGFQGLSRLNASCQSHFQCSTEQLAELGRVARGARPPQDIDFR